MGSTQERKKQRRAYLKKIGWAYTIMSLAALLVIPAGVAALFGGVIVLSFFHPLADYSDGFRLFVAGISGLTILGLGGASFLLAYFARQAHRTIKQLPYVPPVTTDTLLAEEVLVRGSEEPTQEQSKVLLRGTDVSTGTGEQELLRGSHENRNTR